MKTYEMPEGKATGDGAAEVAEETRAAYSLEEQVRRTSESVERLSGIMSAFLSEIRGNGVDQNAEA